ncbi:tricorn protease-like protein [Lacibacter cauensis]|uniref:Tricorn protease homolog n=1 Tax=Lacibacter cauensis TaxID=510947 RepID=A0A562SR93_9BACT|nr:S41 family peptidase [Lacibacter cauensis]TWI83653.1 tricorn protease-like protein [Lacibacter cauensis]
MKHLLSTGIICLISFFSTAQNSSYFLSNPTLTPDGQTVVFAFEGDLWKANVNDLQATRITAMQGYETSPRISPDGKWIAFTGRQYGNADVFVMPLAGGEVKQITFHSGNDEVTSWSWDSKSIYFNSSRAGQIAGFKVAAAGGTPQRVFGNYFFQYDHNLVEHPATGEIFFNDTWESASQVQRKRYKGPFNPDIQSYNFKTKQHKKYTSWEGKDFAATIDKNGNVFFISDENNGEYNLYTLDAGKKKALTRFASSIKTPQVNANGGKVVFEKDYQLWLYDVKTDKERKLDIGIVRNHVLPKEKDYEVRGNISAFDVSPDAKKFAFVVRGELFVSDIDGKFVQQINRGSAERVREVRWMNDNKTILFTQTVDGYANLFTVRADSSAAPKQLTSDQQNNRSVIVNKKRTLAVYLSGRNEVRLLDLKTLQSKTLVKDELWAFQNSDPGFSPNDEYVLFTARCNFEEDILVHHIKNNKTINLTNSGVTENSPVWSPDGKYIYFVSQRLKPAYPFGMANAKVYRVALEKMDEPYRIDKFNDLFKEEKKEAKGANGDSGKVINIDTDLIMERLEQIGPSFGTQYLINVYQKGEKTSVLYASNHGEGRFAIWKTVLESFESTKTDKIAGTDNAGGLDIVEAGDKYFALGNGTINKLNLDANRIDPVNISYTFRRNLQEEFTQMFYEAWAGMEEGYYDENFHGLNWKKTKTYYQQFLPYLNNRADLRTLLNDMLGELNSSHQGFATFGDDETIALTSATMETGIIFENDDPYKVKYIVKRSAADRKNIDIKPGDVLVKVNDETVDANKDRNAYFTLPSRDRELKLTFKRGAEMVQVKIHPQATLFNNLYDEWVDNNQKRVDEKSKGRIAYGYMKNMGTGELEQFINDMTQELTSKDALIFDLRYNTGGNVHDEVLKFLSQRSYLQWKYREGKLAPQSNFAPSDKPIILLINEQSLSDAEMTAQGFKGLKLGKIIGNGTYRWIIFTSGIGLVDGSSVRMPAWGCYSLEGKDLEINGVEPDIRIINSFEDKLNGNDPQLDKAIEEILKQIKS